MKKIISILMSLILLCSCSVQVFASTDFQNEIQPYVITNNESRFWGYSYYYNTDSAYLHVYWRIWNPENSTTPQKYFFSEYTTDVQKYAEIYRDIVLDIRHLEDNILDFATIESVRIILNALSIAAAVQIGSATAIASNIKQTMAIAQNMTEQTVLFIAEAYILADQANRAYENVLTAIKRRDELET